MLINITIAAVIFVLTTGIHAGGMNIAIRRQNAGDSRWRKRVQSSHILRVGEVVLLMFLVSLMEVLVWAVAYLSLNAIQGFERALYFSMVSFTTLGYGEIVLDERWRLLSSFEAANGIIMFGWTTAIVIASVQKAYFEEKNNG